MIKEYAFKAYSDRRYCLSVCIRPFEYGVHDITVWQSVWRTQLAMIWCFTLVCSLYVLRTLIVGTFVRFHVSKLQTVASCAMQAYLLNHTQPFHSCSEPCTEGFTQQAHSEDSEDIRGLSISHARGQQMLCTLVRKSVSAKLHGEEVPAGLQELRVLLGRIPGYAWKRSAN